VFSAWTDKKKKVNVLDLNKMTNPARIDANNSPQSSVGGGRKAQYE